MDQLICPACNEPAGFYVFEEVQATTCSVSADGDVLSEENSQETVTTITCEGCGAEPDADLWDEIYALIHGLAELQPHVCPTCGAPRDPARV